jgi:hypothetical protein
VSRIALFYFCFSLVYCIAQLSFQGWALKINSEAGTRLSDIINSSGVKLTVNTDGRLVVVEGLALFQNAPLRNHTAPIDSTLETSSLISTSTSSDASASTAPSPSSVRSPLLGRPTSIATDETKDRAKVKRFIKRDDGITKVSEGNVTGVFLHDDGETGILLSEACIRAIIWPARTYVA